MAIDARHATMAAALIGASGIAAGAFGAHALKARLEPDALALFDTAARYQLLHALALLGAAGALQRWPGVAARGAVLLFIAGVVLFSGSLYALSAGLPRAFGAITPVGGLCLLLGWLALGAAAWRAPR